MNKQPQKTHVFSLRLNDYLVCPQTSVPVLVRVRALARAGPARSTLLAAAAAAVALLAVLLCAALLVWRRR